MNKILKIGIVATILITSIFAGASLLSFFGRMEQTVNIDSSLFMYNGNIPLEDAVITCSNITERGNHSMNFNITKLDSGNATIYFNITDCVEDGIDVFITLQGSTTPINSFEFTTTDVVCFTHRTSVDMYTTIGTYDTSVTFDKA